MLPEPITNVLCLTFRSSSKKIFVSSCPLNLRARRPTVIVSNLDINNHLYVCHCLRLKLNSIHQGKEGEVVYYITGFIFVQYLRGF